MKSEEMSKIAMMVANIMRRDQSMLQIVSEVKKRAWRYEYKSDMIVVYGDVEHCTITPVDLGIEVVCSLNLDKSCIFKWYDAEGAVTYALTRIGHYRKVV